MTAFVGLKLTNGAATPVSKTFAPKSNDGRVTTWENREVGFALGYDKLVVRSSDNDNGRVVKADFMLPTMEVISGNNSTGYTPAPKKAFDDIAKIEFRSNGRTTKLRRQDQIAYMKALLNDPTFVALIIDQDEISG